MDLKGKKVLVTGADGFIGSHLVEALLGEGAHVKALVFYNSFNSYGWLDAFSSGQLKEVEIISGDIRDPWLVADAVKGCDIVFHLAALISIPFSYVAPESFLNTNAGGTLNILQAARMHGTKRVLITSTSEVYGTAQYVPMDELHPLQAQSPYSASKVAADCMGESFYRSFQVPVVIVRPFNTYGPRQSARAIIPAVITQLLSGAKEIKLGRIDPIRDFNYVQDVAHAFCAIARADDGVVGQEINIATGVGISIGEAADKIMTAVGRTAKILFDTERIRPEASEVERLIGLSDKLKLLTGWSPRFNFEKGILETIDWFRNPDNLARYKSTVFNI